MKKKRILKRTFWGLPDFRVDIRKRVNAVAITKNLTAPALVEEIILDYLSRKSTRSLLNAEIKN